MGFWCGFCVRVVQLTKSGLDAWDERFDHIDDEHFKKDQRIESWFPIDKDLPTRMLQNGGLIEGGRASPGESACDDYDDAHEPGGDRSSDSEVEMSENVHSTPPSMISEIPQTSPLDRNRATTTTSGISTRLNPTHERNVWFCVSHPTPTHLNVCFVHHIGPHS